MAAIPPAGRRIVATLCTAAVLTTVSCEGEERADTASSARESPTPVAVQVDPAAVEGATLSIADMETGWSEYEISGPETDFVKIGGEIGAGNVPGPIRSRSLAAFEQGQSSPLVPSGYVSNTVVLMETEAAAQAVMDAFRSASQTRTWTQAFSESDNTYKLAALAFENVGDETFAVRLNLTAKLREFGTDVESQIDYIVFRVGPVVSFIFAVLADSGPLARKSASKVNALVRGQ